jgi:hypothetical protein
MYCTESYVKVHFFLIRPGTYPMSGPVRNPRMEKRMKNQTGFWAVCLLAAALFLLPQAAQAQCSLASLSGNYVFNNAAISFVISPVIANVMVGTMTADGAGHITFTETAFALDLQLGFPAGPTALLPIPGTKIMSESTYTGTYLVGPDCRAALTLQSSNFNCLEGTSGCFFPIHFDLVLVRGGKSFYLIDSDPGFLASGAGTHI